jgi:hypothetical protein
MSVEISLDYVAIVIHNYRSRIGLAEGETDGSSHPVDPTAYRQKVTGKYASRIITAGIGYNLPQEAPQAFAEAVIDVDRY